MGQVSIRVIGEIEDIKTFVKSVETIYGRLLTQGPYENKRGDVGYRVYFTVTVKEENPDDRRK